jgi:hypothetical protein
MIKTTEEIACRWCSNHKKQDINRKWLDYDKFLKTLESWKPVGEEYELSKGDKMYTDIINEIIDDIKKKACSF